MSPDISTSVVAATSALSGVIVAQLGGVFRAFFDKKNQRASMLRDKLEELADNVHKTTEWVDHLATRVNMVPLPHGSAGANSHIVSLSTESRRVYVLSLLYFPDLRDDSKKFFNATSDMYLQFTAKSVDIEQIHELTSAYALAKKNIDELVKIEAEKLT